MRYFDYESVAREAGISDRDLAAIAQLIRRDFPADDMMWELHVLRACSAVKDGRAALEQVGGRQAT